jgi:hypothetical protein
MGDQFAELVGVPRIQGPGEGVDQIARTGERGHDGRGACAKHRVQGRRLAALPEEDRPGPPEVLARIAQGGVVDPADYYFRMQMTFETASATYGWLNRSIVVGSAMRLASAVVYDAYLVA